MCVQVTFSNISPWHTPTPWSVVFDHTSMRNGGTRTLINHVVNTPIMGVDKRKPVGVQGNYISRTGFEGQHLEFTVEYINTLPAIRLHSQEDMYYTMGRSNNIVLEFEDSYSETYERCTCLGWSPLGQNQGITLPTRPNISRSIFTVSFRSEEPAIDVITA